MLPMKGITEALRESAAGSLALGRRQEAMLLLAKLFLIDPSDPVNFTNLADLCQFTGKWRELEEFSGVRLSHIPNDGEALCRLANACFARKQYARSLDCLKQATAFNPGHVKALIELSRLLKRFGDVDGAIRCLKNALLIEPESSAAQDNLVFTMLFSDRFSPEEIFEAHRLRSAGFNSRQTAAYSPGSDERIRVGYVSPDFREHSVALFIEPVIRLHDRSEFEIYCYHTHPDQDDTTSAFKNLPVQWRDISGINDTEAYRLVLNDKIQILVDLAGFTAWNRLPLFAMRPAPVQVTWIGYPHSTGMTAIDYRITDNYADPPGMTEPLHTEQLLRLSPPFLSFQSQSDCRPRQLSPLDHNNGAVTFASFNNLAKAGPKVIRCWIKILDSLPGSRLLLKSEIFSDPEAAALTVENLGLDDSRIITVEAAPDRGSHLEYYNRVDIALDTFPYNGTTTTCEALSMGVPVVTLAGRHHAARVGVSILSSVGHKELIAENCDDYVRIAVDLANDMERLKSLHRALPGEVQASPLTDPEKFTASLEEKFREIWKNSAIPEQCRTDGVKPPGCILP